MDTTLFAQNGGRLDLDAVLDDTGGVAGHRHGRTLDTGPGTDLAAPAHNRVHDAGVVLDLSILQDDRLLHADTASNGSARTDRHVGAKLRSGVDVGGGVNEYGRDDVGRGLSKLLRTVLPRLLQIEGVGGHSRACSLDLSPKVLGFVHEELLAIGHVAEDLLLEADDLALALVVILILVHDVRILEVLGGSVRSEAGPVCATLDGTLDRGEDNVGAEQVDTAVDEV